MKKIAITLAFAAAFLLGTAGDVYGQTTANATASITIPQVLFVEISTNTIAFNQPDGTDYETGNIGANNTMDLTHKGNIVHDVELTADNANFSSVSNAKPASDLEWSKNGGASWTGASTAAVDVVTAAAKGAHVNAETLSYRVLLDYSTDEPDTYTLGLTFTVVAN